MSTAALSLIAAFIITVTATVGTAQVQAPDTQPKPAVQAFTQYERVRVALAADTFADVAAPAKELAAMIEPVAGAEAKKAADSLVAAKNIEDARTHFGELSEILVPVFQAESIPGAYAFTCSMVRRPWMQKGQAIENPYYGKSMLACGTPLPKK